MHQNTLPTLFLSPSSYLCASSTPTVGGSRFRRTRRRLSYCCRITTPGFVSFAVVGVAIFLITPYLHVANTNLKTMAMVAPANAGHRQYDHAKSSAASFKTFLFSRKRKSVDDDDQTDAVDGETDINGESSFDNPSSRQMSEQSFSRADVENAFNLLSSYKKKLAAMSSQQALTATAAYTSPTIGSTISALPPTVTTTPRRTTATTTTTTTTTTTKRPTTKKTVWTRTTTKPRTTATPTTTITQKPTPTPKPKTTAMSTTTTTLTTTTQKPATTPKPTTKVTTSTTPATTTTTTPKTTPTTTTTSKPPPPPTTTTTSTATTTTTVPNTLPTRPSTTTTFAVSNAQQTPSPPQMPPSVTANAQPKYLDEPVPATSTTPDDAMARLFPNAAMPTDSFLSTTSSSSLTGFVSSPTFSTLTWQTLLGNETSTENSTSISTTLEEELTTPLDPDAPVYTPWSEWSACSATCGIGERARVKNCIKNCPTTDASTPSGGQPGQVYVTEPCESPIPCPAAPLTPWSAWSECSVTCGNGTRVRVRECLLESKQCNVPLREQRPCMTRPCSDGQWSAWSRWSQCSAQLAAASEKKADVAYENSTSCGLGTQTRKRVCLMPDKPGVKVGEQTKPGADIAKECDGADVEALGCVGFACVAEDEIFGVEFDGKRTMDFDNTANVKSRHIVNIYARIKPRDSTGVLLTFYNSNDSSHTITMGLDEGIVVLEEVLPSTSWFASSRSSKKRKSEPKKTNFFSFSKPPAALPLVSSFTTSPLPLYTWSSISCSVVGPKVLIRINDGPLSGAVLSQAVQLGNTIRVGNAIASSSSAREKLTDDSVQGFIGLVSSLYINNVRATVEAGGTKRPKREVSDDEDAENEEAFDDDPAATMNESSNVPSTDNVTTELPLQTMLPTDNFAQTSSPAEAGTSSSSNAPELAANVTDPVETMSSTDIYPTLNPDATTESGIPNENDDRKPIKPPAVVQVAGLKFASDDMQSKPDAASADISVAAAPPVEKNIIAPQIYMRGSHYVQIPCFHCHSESALKISFSIQPIDYQRGILLVVYGTERSQLCVISFDSESYLKLCASFVAGDPPLCTYSERLFPATTVAAARDAASDYNAWYYIELSIKQQAIELSLNGGKTSGVYSMSGHVFVPKSPIMLGGAGEMDQWSTLSATTADWSAAEDAGNNNDTQAGYVGFLHSQVTVNDRTFQLGSARQAAPMLWQVGRVLPSFYAHIARQYTEVDVDGTADVEIVCDVAAHYPPRTVGGGESTTAAASEANATEANSTTPANVVTPRYDLAQVIWAFNHVVLNLTADVEEGYAPLTLSNNATVANSTTLDQINGSSVDAHKKSVYRLQYPVHGMTAASKLTFPIRQSTMGVYMCIFQHAELGVSRVLHTFAVAAEKILDDAEDLLLEESEHYGAIVLAAGLSMLAVLAVYAAAAKLCCGEDAKSLNPKFPLPPNLLKFRQHKGDSGNGPLINYLHKKANDIRQREALEQQKLEEGKVHYDEHGAQTGESLTRIVKPQNALSWPNRTTTRKVQLPSINIESTSYSSSSKQTENSSVSMTQTTASGTETDTASPVVPLHGTISDPKWRIAEAYNHVYRYSSNPYLMNSSSSKAKRRHSDGAATAPVPLNPKASLARSSADAFFRSTTSSSATENGTSSLTSASEHHAVSTPNANRRESANLTAKNSATTSDTTSTQETEPSTHQYENYPVVAVAQQYREQKHERSADPKSSQARPVDVGENLAERHRSERRKQRAEEMHYLRNGGPPSSTIPARRVDERQQEGIPTSTTDTENTVEAEKTPLAATTNGNEAKSNAVEYSGNVVAPFIPAAVIQHQRERQLEHQQRRRLRQLRQKLQQEEQERMQRALLLEHYHKLDVDNDGKTASTDTTANRRRSSAELRPSLHSNNKPPPVIVYNDGTPSTSLFNHPQPITNRTVQFRPYESVINMPIATDDEDAHERQELLTTHRELRPEEVDRLTVHPPAHQYEWASDQQQAPTTSVSSVKTDDISSPLSSAQGSLLDLPVDESAGGLLQQQPLQPIRLQQQEQPSQHLYVPAPPGAHDEQHQPNKRMRPSSAWRSHRATAAQQQQSTAAALLPPPPAADNVFYSAHASGYHTYYKRASATDNVVSVWSLPPSHAQQQPAQSVLIPPSNNAADSAGATAGSSSSASFSAVQPRRISLSRGGGTSASAQQQHPEQIDGSKFSAPDLLQNSTIH